jgi:hypothetical protein
MPGEFLPDAPKNPGQIVRIRIHQKNLEDGRGGGRGDCICPSNDPTDGGAHLLRQVARVRNGLARFCLGPEDEERDRILQAERLLHFQLSEERQDTLVHDDGGVPHAEMSGRTPGPRAAADDPFRHRHALWAAEDAQKRTAVCNSARTAAGSSLTTSRRTTVASSRMFPGQGYSAKRASHSAESSVEC